MTTRRRKGKQCCSYLHLVLLLISTHVGKQFSTQAQDGRRRGWNSIRRVRWTATTTTTTTTAVAIVYFFIVVTGTTATAILSGIIIIIITIVISGVGVFTGKLFKYDLVATAECFHANRMCIYMQKGRKEGRKEGGRRANKQ